MTDRKEALARLDQLVGVWDTAPVVDGVQVMRGMTEISWAEDGAFLVQRVTNELLDTAPDGWREHAPRTTVWIVGLDDDAYTALYADSRGVHRVYSMEFDGRTWILRRDAPGFRQRFSAELSDDARTIVGSWEFAEDGEWRTDFEMTLTRIR
jgi:hypothetical protein